MDFNFLKKAGGIPKSVGIIMDGNRRFAKELMKRPWKGHEFGTKKAREVLEWSCELGIKYMTVYSLSVENLRSRPKIELNKIMECFDREMDCILSGDHPVHETKTRVKFIGRTGLLPKKLWEKMKKVEKMTGNYGKHFLNIAVAYGGQQEIVDACKDISLKVAKGLLKLGQINESVFRESLYTNGMRYPDLIIRTGGDRRISNFLPWQAAYSELAFTDEKWPEFSREKFMKIIRDYQKRERRFGK